MARVVHFELQADDPERASTFYKAVFGWDIKKWAGEMDYWLVATGPKDAPGIDGAIMKRMSPGGQTINTIAVEDLDASVKMVRKAGGKVVTKRQTIPGIGLFCYCTDTEGNSFGMLQPDMKAK
jgi:predicted enzyme related to lactoylglutathione lyase